MLADWLGLDVGPVGRVVLWVLAGLLALWVGRFVYELSDGDGVGDSLRDSSEWFGALLGAFVGVVAIVMVEGVEAIALFVDFVGSHALGVVAAGLTALGAAIAEGFISMSGTTVIGIAVALTGAAMLSVRWVNDW